MEKMAKNKLFTKPLKKLGRSDKCKLCSGNSGVISKYKLYVCRHCLRDNYVALDWQKGR